MSFTLWAQYFEDTPNETVRLFENSDAPGQRVNATRLLGGGLKMPIPFFEKASRGTRRISNSIPSSFEIEQRIIKQRII